MVNQTSDRRCYEDACYLLLLSPLRPDSFHACPIPLNRRLTGRVVGMSSRNESIASRLNQFLHHLLSGFPTRLDIER